MVIKIIWCPAYGRLTLFGVYRSTFPNKWKLTARSAPSTPCTRSPSTRRARTPCLDREREDMMLSRLGSVARPSPSSERSPRPPRRSLSSLNAPSARPVDWTPSSVANHSFSERRTSPRVAPSSEHSHFVKKCWLIDLAASATSRLTWSALS